MFLSKVILLSILILIIIIIILNLSILRFRTGQNSSKCFDKMTRDHKIANNIIVEISSNVRYVEITRHMEGKSSILWLNLTFLFLIKLKNCFCNNRVVMHCESWENAGNFKIQIKNLENAEKFKIFCRSRKTLWILYLFLLKK